MLENFLRSRAAIERLRVGYCLSEPYIERGALELELELHGLSRLYMLKPALEPASASNALGRSILSSIPRLPIRQQIVNLSPSSL
jgi:hypothetical protein